MTYVGSPEEYRDDALRRVANSLAIDLRRVREQISNNVRSTGALQIRERRIQEDIDTLGRLREELKGVARSAIPGPVYTGPILCYDEPCMEQQQEETPC